MRAYVGDFYRRKRRRDGDDAGSRDDAWVLVRQMGDRFAWPRERTRALFDDAWAEAAAGAAPQLEPLPDEPADAWPDPVDDAAYYGLAGELVQAVAPYTEADPVGLLGVLLATFGAVAGNARALYQTAQHAPNLFVVLVGESSVSRKGTALGVVRAAFDAGPHGKAWQKAVVLAGLGSGEGLLGFLDRKNKVPDGAPPITVPDLRALIVEGEYGRVLLAANRTDSTLSPILRDAWDGVTLGRNLAREGSTVVGAHVGLVGAVTQEELRARLTDVDAANGYANRHLFMSVRRQRLLAHPPDVRQLVAPYAAALWAAVDAARVPADLHWTPDAADLWESVYAGYAAQPRYGLLGAMTARAEAQTVRLALCHALLNRADAIDVPHLQAAVALWRYAERSARYVFGDSTGNRHADALRRELRVAGQLSREDVRNVLGLRSAADLDDVTGVLCRLGLAEMRQVKSGGGRGRPALWVVATDRT